MPALPRPTKITFADMRDMGVRGLLIYCSDYKCSHSIAISADKWPDHVWLSDLETRFVCQACGKRGTDVRALGNDVGDLRLAVNAILSLDALAGIIHAPRRRVIRLIE
jgi:hypothetical protein